MGLTAAASAVNVATAVRRVVQAMLVVVKLSVAALVVAAVVTVVLTVLQLTALLWVVLVAALLVTHIADRALVAAAAAAIVDYMPAFVAVAVQDAEHRCSVVVANPHLDGKASSLAQSRWNWCCMSDRCCARPMQLSFRQGRYAALYDSR